MREWGCTTELGLFWRRLQSRLLHVEASSYLPNDMPNYPMSCPGFLRSVLDCLLPPVCALCGAEVEREVVCAACCRGFDPAPRPAAWTGIELRAAFPFAGPGQRLIHAFKYEGRRDLAEPLADWIRQTYDRDGWPRCDLLVPIPLHRRRLLRRGYNQSHLLALALGRRLDLPVADLLARRRATRSQTRLTIAERRRNLAGAFALRAAGGRGWNWRRTGWTRRRSSAVDWMPQRLAGRHVLLVDDVCTTGATLGEAAARLRAAGVSTVTYQVAARADPASSGAS